MAGACDTATVDITVNNVNEQPTDQLPTPTGLGERQPPVTVDVLGNDTGVDDGRGPGVGDGHDRPSNGSTAVEPGRVDQLRPDPALGVGE